MDKDMGNTSMTWSIEWSHRVKLQRGFTASEFKKLGCHDIQSTYGLSKHITAVIDTSHVAPLFITTAGKRRKSDGRGRGTGRSSKGPSRKPKTHPAKNNAVNEQIEKPPDFRRQSRDPRPWPKRLIRKHGLSVLAANSHQQRVREHKSKASTTVSWYRTPSKFALRTPRSPPGSVLSLQFQAKLYIEAEADVLKPASAVSKYTIFRKIQSFDLTALALFFDFL